MKGGNADWLVGNRSIWQGILPWAGLLPGYSGMKSVSFRILFEHSGSKAAANNHLSSIFGCIVATTRTTNGTPAPCSTTGMMQDNHLLLLGVTWDFTCGNCCVIVKKCWAMMIVFSQSAVFHLVFWVFSSTEKSRSTTRRFDDRPSLERARHEFKKKR